MRVTDRAGWGYVALFLAAYLWPQAGAGEWAVKSRVFAAVLAGLGGYAVLRGRASRGLAWPWLGLAGWLAATVLWSLDGPRSIVQVLAIAGAAAIVLFRWPVVSARMAARATLGLAVADSLLALMQRAALPPGTGLRVAGSFVNANHHAALACAGVGVAAAWVVTMRGRARWWAVAALVLLVGDVLTGGSRAGLLALAVIVVLARRWRPRGFRWAGWAVVFVAIIVAVASPNGAVRRLAAQAKGGEPRAFARAGMWDASLRMIRHSPMGGIGPGGFVEAWPGFRAREFAMFVTDYAHSEIMQVAVELGLIGLGLAIWGFACWWRIASRFSMADPDRYAAGAALAAFAIFALVDFPLHVPVLALLVVFLASSLAMSRKAIPTPSAVPARPVAMAAATVGLVAVWLACGASADLAYLDGARRVAGGDLAGARARFDLALAAEPAHPLALEAEAELDLTGPLTPGRLDRVRRLRPVWVAPLSTAFDRSLALGDSAGARRARAETVAVDPWGLTGELMDVTLAMKAGSLEFAARRIAEIATRWPGVFDVELLRADVATARGRPAEARGILREMDRRFPGSAAVRDRLAKVAR
ncbi:MAG: O-antigen ligase family protein [Candidatus Coatesbacteria bacterium]